MRSSLGANTTVAASGNVTFISTIDGNTSGNQSLTVNSSGITTFEAAVGNTTRLSTLTTDAAGSTDLNGGIVKTTGNQTYNDAITLTANTSLTGSNVNFNGTVNDVTQDADSLLVTGNASFKNPVGASCRISSR